MNRRTNIGLIICLLAFCTTTLAAKAKVKNVKFESKMVGISLPYNVVLPPDYEDESARNTRYPVLYLLHGLMGSAENWVSKRTNLSDYASLYRIILISPEGHDGWYTDSGTIPTDKYESYI